LATSNRIDLPWKSQHVSDEIFRLLVEGVRDYAIYMLDVNGYIKTWNLGAERAKQYKAQDIVGKHFSVFYTEEDRANNRPQYNLDTALRDGRVEDEGWRVRQDGTRFWADVIITALYDEYKTHIGFAKITRDMSEQRKLKIAREEAITASQAKSAFLANMSHELRTPLTAIIGYTELLLEQVKDQNLLHIAEDVTKIQYSGQHLLSIINDILDLSKIEAGGIELNMSSVDPGALVHRVAEAIEPLAKCNGTSVDVTVSDGVDVIVTDELRLRQILYNLLSNAAKFTVNGRISVTVSPSSGHDRHSFEPVDAIKIEISDTGIGMSAEHAASIFERFYRVETHAMEFNKGGTGLGLAISRMFSEALGGSISVESTEGVGSTFTLLFPKRQAM